MSSGSSVGRPEAGTRLSVVIPAHNESRVIRRCLAPMTALGEAGVAEVVVVCNGCTDDTAEVARDSAPWATVVEIPQASKPAALNMGDEMASAFPRIYVDADVEVPEASLLKLAGVLESGPALAGAPRLHTDTSASPYPVRAFVRVWSELPYARDSLVGAGVYGMSRAGRSRFGTFPDLIADDQFVHSLFRSSERIALEEAEYVSFAPRRTRDLVRRLVRVYSGNAELRRHAGTPRGHTTPGAILTVLANRPRLGGDVVVFLAISVLAKTRAAGRRRLRRSKTWHRDESSRMPMTGAARSSDQPARAA